MTARPDERLAVGVEQLEAQAKDLEGFVATLSAGVLPEPDAIAKTRHDIANMVAGLEALRTVIEREAVERQATSKRQHRASSRRASG